VLSQVVGEEKFKRWFATSKSSSSRTRASGPRQEDRVLHRREEPVSAETEIMEEFTNTRSARRRISLAEDLLAASIKEEAKPSLAQVLSGITEAVRDSNQLDAASASTAPSSATSSPASSATTFPASPRTSPS